MDYDCEKISIIMPTYNRSELLNRVVSSILAQEYENFELIIVNDGSKDNTREICERYKKVDNRIKYIEMKNNSGSAAARNIGIDNSNGRYITFIDDDDYVESTMLEFLHNLIVKYKADISICGSVYDNFGILKDKYVFDEILVLNKAEGVRELLKREKYNSSNATKLFKKELFEKIRFDESKRVDDIHVIYKVFSQANKVVALGKPLYICTLHDKNGSLFDKKNRWNSALLKEYILMQEERVKYLSDKIPDIKEDVEYFELSFMISICDKIYNYREKCLVEYKYMIDRLYKDRKKFMEYKLTTDIEKELMKKYVL